MTLDEVNIWLWSHQLLVSLVATPLISVLVGGFAAWYSGKRVIISARNERVHQSATAIAGYRQTWINELRSDLAEFTGITAISYVTAPPPEKVERVAILAMRIRMRMNRDDADYLKLVGILESALRQFLFGENKHEEHNVSLAVVSQDILKREWERLKGDLREAEE